MCYIFYMKSIKGCIDEAVKNKVAIGHFNISNSEALSGIFKAAQKLGAPVIIGVSEGERDFIGVREAVAMVKALRDEHDYQIFLNADHTYSFERVKEAVDAGFDAVIFDGAKLSLDENIKKTKQCVEYAKAKNPNIIVEGELGYIGTSSKVFDTLPEGVLMDREHLTHSEDAARFVRETGIDLLAPAVGNVHGMFRGGVDPALDIELIGMIRRAAKVPLVLHGGSGTTDDDFKKAIAAGVAIVHINTEIRVAFREGVKHALAENPDEAAPYKFMAESVEDVEKVVEKKLRLFNNL